MQIKTLILGYLDTNCYLVIKDNKCLIIDPAADAYKIMNECKNYQVEGILVTRHHLDHIQALEELEKNYNLKHNSFNEKSFSYEVINTPGHTKDSISFYFKESNLMFTGDFIFYHSIGRYDFKDSNISDMKKSLNKIKQYSDDIIIYPGHGRKTNLKEEKKLFDLYF